MAALVPPEEWPTALPMPAPPALRAVWVGVCFSARVPDDPARAALHSAAQRFNLPPLPYRSERAGLLMVLSTEVTNRAPADLNCPQTMGEVMHLLAARLTPPHNAWRLKIDYLLPQHADWAAIMVVPSAASDYMAVEHTQWILEEGLASWWSQWTRPHRVLCADEMRAVQSAWDNDRRSQSYAALCANWSETIEVLRLNHQLGHDLGPLPTHTGGRVRL